MSPTRVRSLLERFALTVDLDSTTYADVQRDFGGLLGSRLTEVELWALIDWLALRLLTPSARERFLVDVADLRV
ncbi:MAG: hypothetical protein H5U40_10060 [Polyangiaceae bacterium]|nr:hypothetical protein [Polyangiaceae bacterium]